MWIMFLFWQCLMKSNITKRQLKGSRYVHHSVQCCTDFKKIKYFPFFWIFINKIKVEILRPVWKKNSFKVIIYEIQHLWTFIFNTFTSDTGNRFNVDLFSVYQKTMCRFALALHGLHLQNSSQSNTPQEFRNTPL